MIIIYLLIIKRSFDKVFLFKNLELIYIQVIIHWYEIVYSIEMMNESEESAENQIMKFIIL